MMPRFPERPVDPMNEQLIGWLISLVAGGAGGNVVGALLKNKSLGPVLNTVLGLAGGAGGQLLPSLIPALGALVGGAEPGNYAGTGGLSAVLGALLPLILGMLKKPANG